MMLDTKRMILPDFKMVSEDGPGEFIGYGSIFGNLDRQKDICDPGCFRNSLGTFLKDGFIADNHDWPNDVAMPVDAVETNEGLRIHAQFHSDPLAQQRRTRVMERLAAGKSVGLSIGYSIRPGGVEQKADGRHLTDLDLVEVSIVSMPANPLAQVTAAKAMGAEAPAGTYEDLAEDIGEAYTTRFGGMAFPVATYPDHAVLCVMATDSMGQMGDMTYVDVPYAQLTDGTITLGTPTPVEAQTTYVPTDDVAKGFLLPLRAFTAALKAGRTHSSATMTRYTAMQEHLSAMQAHLEHLVTEANPPDPGKGRQLLAEYLAIEARRLGVAV